MTSLEKYYYINVGAKGEYNNSDQNLTKPEDLKDIFDFMDENDTEKLLLYFHGGLVDRKNGIEAAKLMKEKLADRSANRHVVSFVWETGPIETVTQNLNDLINLSNEGFFKEVTNFVIKLVNKRLGFGDSRGSGEYLTDSYIDIEKNKLNSFENLDHEFNNRTETYIEIDDEDENFSEYYKRLEAESNMLLENEGSEEIKNKKESQEELSRWGGILFAKVIAQITFAVLKRYLNKTHHDFYPTIIEETFRKLYFDEVGSWGWRKIKEKSKMMFQAKSEIEEEYKQPVGIHFLTLLERHVKRKLLEKKRFEIELIGHSAGSVAICNLLHSTESLFSNIRYNNVFFLAPACTVNLFIEKGIKAYNNGIFKSFKMFTMEEDFEKMDHCIPYIYTRSLLYLVSGLFEDEIDTKIMGLHEHIRAEGRYSSFEELVKINRFLNKHQLVLSVDKVNPNESMRSTSENHAAFDNDETTLLSILKSI